MPTGRVAPDMSVPGAAPTGLLLATGMSLSNVFLEVFRKKEMQGQDFLRTTFLHRAVMALILSLVLLAHWHLTGVPVILPRLLSADVFPFLFAQRRYFAYLAADSILIVLIVALYNRAVQIAPLSTTIPFLSFTPVFLLGTGYVILGELPTLSQGEGVLFIVLGSLLMHRRSYRQGFFAPFHALFRERAGRYMMAVSFLYSLTNPLDKKLVQASDFYIYSWAYAVVSVLIFALLMAPRLLDQNVRHGPVKAGWILAAGVTDSLTVFLQFFAVSLINVVLVIAIKRAGIIVTVMAGWLVFREKHIGDRLIAASVMLAGVLMVYIPMSVRLQVLWTVFTLVSLGIALAYTREIPTLSTPSESL